MLQLHECKRGNLCADCDDPNCLHAGYAVADCPLYYCNRSPEQFEECESCELMSEIRTKRSEVQ